MNTDNIYLPTFTGKQFHFLDPHPDEIDIRDISHSLAGLPRYLCHTVHPYSVAEHCVRLVSYALEAYDCSKEKARAILLHDAAEAYLGEWPKPIKMSLLGEQFRVYEDKIQSLIYEKYNCKPDATTALMIGQLDRAIVYVETKMSNQMSYENLPIPLTLDEIWLGKQMYRFFQPLSIGWGYTVAKMRFIENARWLGIT